MLLRRFPWLLASILTLTLALPWAFGQDLAELAPADAILTLDYERPPELNGDLSTMLSELRWEDAGRTLERVIEIGGGSALAHLDLEFLELGGMFGDGGRLQQELQRTCPAWPSDANPADLLEEGLLTVGISPFHPFPTVTAIARVRDADAAEAAALHETLVACFGSRTFTQDGTELHVLTDGDVPAVVANIGNVYVVATTLDAVRGVIRRASGASEPSLANNDLNLATQRFEGTGVGIAVDLGRAADAIQAFAGPGASDTPDGYLQARLLAAARTLGGVAMRWGITPEGILAESVVAVNPVGGDPALAELLLCNRCNVSRALLAPAGSAGVTSQHIPLRGITRYVQSWLDGVAAVTGEDLDLRELSRGVLGFDLDVALLDWIGTEIHIVQLAPFEPSIGSLIYGAPTALYIPVSSQEAARQGLDAWGDALAPWIAEIAAGGPPRFGPGRSMFDALDGFDAAAGAEWIAVRPGNHRGVPFERIQIGPVMDVAVAFVGNHLVVASPSAAVEPIIETFQGARASLASDAYARARALAPDGATAVHVHDVGADLGGVADLAGALAQPAAALLAAVVQDGAHRDDVTEPAAPIGPDLPSVTREIAWGELPLIYGAELTEDNRDAFGEPVDAYRLVDVPPGALIRVAVESEVFDTYLYVYDDEGQFVDSNDDAGLSSNSALSFTATTTAYRIEVASFGGNGTGPYQLTVDQGDVGELPSIDLEGVDPENFSVPGVLQGDLDAGDRLPNGEVGRIFALGDVDPGQLLELELTSDAFDTYLRVIRPDAGVILVENDDAPDTMRSAVSVASTDHTLWVQVTSWSGDGTGPFELRVATSNAAASDRTEPTIPANSQSTNDDSETAEPPSFVELLKLTDILPRALEILSEHVGHALGHAEVDGSVIYRRSLIEVAW